MASKRKVFYSGRGKRANGCGESCARPMPFFGLVGPHNCLCTPHVFFVWGMWAQARRIGADKRRGKAPFGKRLGPERAGAPKFCANGRNKKREFCCARGPSGAGAKKRPWPRPRVAANQKICAVGREIAPRNIGILSRAKDAQKKKWPG